MFGQLAVLILVGTHLMFADHDPGAPMDNIAALPCPCIWSGGVGLVVAGRTLSHIARHLITRMLPTVDPEDEVLKQIQIEVETRLARHFMGLALHVAIGINTTTTNST